MSGPPSRTNTLDELAACLGRTRVQFTFGSPPAIVCYVTPVVCRWNGGSHEHRNQALFHLNQHSSGGRAPQAGN